MGRDGTTKTVAALSAFPSALRAQSEQELSDMTSITDHQGGRQPFRRQSGREIHDEYLARFDRDRRRYQRRMCDPSLVGFLQNLQSSRKMRGAVRL